MRFNRSESGFGFSGRLFHYFWGSIFMNTQDLRDLDPLFKPFSEP
jgi:hypothetical protein